MEVLLLNPLRKVMFSLNSIIYLFFIQSEPTEAGKEDAPKNANIQETTSALKRWREAVTNASSSAQLSMCIHMLNTCIAWERSIMKVVSSRSEGVQRVLSPLTVGQEQFLHSSFSPSYLKKVMYFFLHSPQ